MHGKGFVWGSGGLTHGKGFVRIDNQQPCTKWHRTFHCQEQCPTSNLTACHSHSPVTVLCCTASGPINHLAAGPAPTVVRFGVARVQGNGFGAVLRGGEAEHITHYSNSNTYHPSSTSSPHHFRL